MTNTHLALAVFALYVLGRPARTSQAVPLAGGGYGYLADPTTWGADQWARLYSADMPPTDAQSPHSAYGLTSCKCTGFNA